MELKGVLDLAPEGHGYLRPKFIPSDKDVYISNSQIRKFLLRPGDWVEGIGRAPKETERYFGLLRVDKINGLSIEDPQIMNRPNFDDLTPIYPDLQLKLETTPDTLSTRIIDLVAPIGRGQRGLIVSPPKAGKTWLLKEIANGITANFPDYHLMVALVGERPEEVTDIARGTKGEVIASNFDQTPREQVRVAEVTLDRARRLVEMGKNVVILLDSITRLARAYNLCIPSSGRTLSGGFDPAALFPPKQFLGAARCVEDGGSLTIIGSALVDTDSRMDDLIYEEFKGTGNMELHLDRKLADKRIYPAIDVGRSGTRNFERLVTPEKLKKLDTLIKMLHLLNDEERTPMLIEKLMHTKSNEEFLESLAKGA
jgi:transcription termination factor Rho